MTYDIILADPPWDYAGQKQHSGKNSGDTGGAIVHYPTMKLPELMKMDVKSISAPNSLLFMWTTGPQLFKCIDIMKAWGFSYKTVAFVWDKGKVNPGSYTMSQTEFVLVAKRGSIPKPRGLRNVRQLLEASEKILVPRTAHSEKPEEVQDRIDLMFPTQRKLEMFARRERSGWDLYGNEVPNSIIIPTKS